MIYLFIFLGLISLSYLILIFLTSPAGRIHPDRNLLDRAFIAHRGLHDAANGVPENSLFSFQRAIENKLPIEIDIHLTKDDQVVVFHDDNAERMCGDPRKIEEMTLDEIKELKLLNTGENIPTLRECLDLVRGKVFLLIEFKVCGNNAEKLCEKANDLLREYNGKYLIQSFYPQVLYWYRKNQKKVCRGQLSAKFENGSLSKKLLGLQLFNFIGRPDFISFKHKDHKSPMFRFAVWQGGKPIGWTFRSQEAFDQDSNSFEGWIFEGFSPKN